MQTVRSHYEVEPTRGGTVMPARLGRADGHEGRPRHSSSCAGHGAELEAWRRNHRHWAAWSAGIDLAIVEAAKPADGMAVLDIASGTGQPALVLASLVGEQGRVVALDVCPGLLAVADAEARRLGLRNVCTRVADAHELPFPDASFDLVTCRFGAHCLSRAATALAEVRRVLRPGGRAVFVTWGAPAQPLLSPVVGMLSRLLDEPRAACGQEGPTRFSRTGSLSELLDDEGFDEVDERPLHVDATWAGSGQQLWSFLAAGLGDQLIRLTDDDRKSLGRTAIAAFERHRRGRVLHLPARVNLAVGRRPVA